MSIKLVWVDIPLISESKLWDLFSNRTVNNIWFYVSLVITAKSIYLYQSFEQHYPFDSLTILWISVSSFIITFAFIVIKSINKKNKMLFKVVPIKLTTKTGLSIPWKTSQNKTLTKMSKVNTRDVIEKISNEIIVRSKNLSIPVSCFPDIQKIQSHLQHSVKTIKYYSSRYGKLTFLRDSNIEMLSN